MPLIGPGGRPRGGRRGATLIEVLVAFILIAATVSASVGVFLNARYFILSASNKSRAARIAQVKLEEYRVKSYSELAGSIARGQSSAQGIDPANPLWSWRVDLAQREVVNPLDTTRRIPYIEITSRARYTQQLGSNTSPREARLVNIVPYPLYRISSIFCDYTKGCGGLPPDCTYDPVYDLSCPPEQPVLPNQWHILTRLPLTNKTRVNLMVMYNIGVSGIPGTGLKPADSLFTFAQVNAWGRTDYEYTTAKSLHTGTPILSQPYISNVWVYENLPPADPANPQQLSLWLFRDPTDAWHTGQDPNSRMEIRWVNLIVIEFEV